MIFSGNPVADAEYKLTTLLTAWKSFFGILYNPNLTISTHSQSPPGTHCDHIEFFSPKFVVLVFANVMAPQFKPASRKTSYTCTRKEAVTNGPIVVAIVASASVTWTECTMSLHVLSHVTFSAPSASIHTSDEVWAGWLSSMPVDDSLLPSNHGLAQIECWQTRSHKTSIEDAAIR